jgi:two-component system, OmpR family, sensor histidine kinase SenX3
MSTTLEQKSPATLEQAKCLQRKEWLLAAFQQALGHELPNRLVAIQGLARLLLVDQGDRLDNMARDILERIADVALETDRTVRGLAEVGRLERDPGPTEVVSLSEIVIEAVAEAKLLFNGHPVEYIIQESMPTVVVPRLGLYVVLQHLLKNAYRAVQTNSAARIEVRARLTPAGAELWIVDNGAGLSAMQLERLFEPSFAATANGGAGFNLFLVRQVVAGWGGCVRVCSEPNKGATFMIRLPSESRHSASGGQGTLGDGKRV